MRTIAQRAAPLALFVPFALAVGCGDNQTPYPTRDRYGADAAAPLGCTPNLDGRIDASELGPALGIPVSYLVSPSGEERPVDVAGVDDGRGGRVWDFSVDLATDQVASLSAGALAGKWYASSFPGGQFTVALDTGGTVEGVYVQDSTSLRLLGVASRDESPAEGQTLLVYDSPVTIFAFPIAPGATWVSAGRVTGGMFRGLPYAGRDTYETRVDAMGVVELPAFRFTQVHRVRTRVTVEPAVGASTSRRQVSLVFECFGEVVRVTSRSDEAEEDFTTAAEVRRLGS